MFSHLKQMSCFCHVFVGSYWLTSAAGLSCWLSENSFLLKKLTLLKLVVCCTSSALGILLIIHHSLSLTDRFLKKKFQKNHACLYSCSAFLKNSDVSLASFYFILDTNQIEVKKCYTGQKSTVSFTMQCWSSCLQIKSTLETILCCFCYSTEHVLPTFPILKNQTSKTNTDAKTPLLLQILEDLEH